MRDWRLRRSIMFCQAHLSFVIQLVFVSRFPFCTTFTRRSLIFLVSQQSDQQTRPPSLQLSKPQYQYLCPFNLLLGLRLVSQLKQKSIFAYLLSSLIFNRKWKLTQRQKVSRKITTSDSISSIQMNRFETGTL